MTVQTAFEKFILSRQLADLSPKTISDYQLFVQPFVAFLGSDADITAVTQEDINSYILTLIKRPLSKSSRATYIRHIKIFLKWIQSDYAVSYDYQKIKVPKSPKKNVKIYTSNEIQIIMDSIHTDSEWLTFRNKCIIALMYDSGLRQSEICTLQKGRISFQDRSIVVHGKGDKERTVPIGNISIHFIREYLSRCPYDSHLLFVNRRGKPLTTNAVKLLVTRLSEKLDFELSSHKLRHNFATNYCIDQYECTGQIDIYRLMILMGHEDIETTRRYLHHANEIISTKSHMSHLDGIFITERKAECV